MHGTKHEAKEGSWPKSVVVIGFPGIAEDYGPTTTAKAIREALPAE